MKPTPEQIEKVKTPEDAIALFGSPVRVVELHTMLWLFYVDFHFKFIKDPASVPTAPLGPDVMRA
jgi:hypothetical protein